MSIFKQKYTDRKTGETRETKKWYGEYVDANGVIRLRVPPSDRVHGGRADGAGVDWN